MARRKRRNFSPEDKVAIAALLDGHVGIWALPSRDTEVARFVRTWLDSLDRALLTDAMAGHINDYERAEHLVARICEF